MATQMCKVAKVDESLFQIKGPTERLVDIKAFESVGSYIQSIIYKPLLQDQINRRYTENEIYDLYDMLNKKQSGLSIWEYKMYYCSGLINRCDLSDEAFMLIVKPLEDMPLYVNDKNREAQVVAIWRLKWAK